MSDQLPADMDRAYELLCKDGNDEGSRRSYLEEHTLDLLPKLIDHLCAPATADVSLESREHADLVLRELMSHGSPKELSLALENQLGVATEEIAQCFYQNEDEGISNPGEDNAGEDTIRSHGDVQKTLKDVHSRLLVVLDTHTQVLKRLRYKKGAAGIIMARNFAERLDLLLAELLQALQAGESLSVKDTRAVLSILAVWCRSVFLWAKEIKASAEELEDLRIKLVDLLLKYFVLLHSLMRLTLLERGYRTLFPDAMFAKTNAGSTTTVDDMKDLTSCQDELMSSLAALGLSSNRHVEWMVGTERNNPDNKHIYYPIAALILTTWQLVEFLHINEGKEADNSLSTAVKGRSDMLTVSLPILGSALNGLAKDAGHIWTWYIAHQMQREGQPADLEEVSLLLELIMPNLAEDPSPVARFALHRLVATLVSLVKEPKDRISLYEQLVSSDNPFDTVRLSSLALLREEISASLRAQDDSIIQDESFWQILGPIMFALPETDPPFGEISLELALQDSTVPWLTECTKILLLLLSTGSSIEQRCKRYVEETQLQSTWISPVRAALARWETEASDPAAVEAAMMLYSLGWTLEQVEAKLRRTSLESSGPCSGRDGLMDGA